MNVKIIVIALFAVVTLLQIYHCKPTHRFVRETKDEDEGRTNKIKEFLSQLYGGSTSQSQPSSTQPDSSTPYQPGSSASNYPDPLTSPLVETPSEPESY
ncbi:uncharacterized protein LOC132950843 [Metopolophium dirhodum]|uniref:uncharacterized protein LOC132950843 n=1 Tax=Metopolophium dirhodum TaxID=44670 RepID=UPI00298F651D|nr:uncharacterized protein LOC132950843 [Metopolophium dirhodum]